MKLKATSCKVWWMKYKNSNHRWINNWHEIKSLRQETSSSRRKKLSRWCQGSNPKWIQPCRRSMILNHKVLNSIRDIWMKAIVQWNRIWIKLVKTHNTINKASVITLVLLILSTRRILLPITRIKTKKLMIRIQRF